MQLSRPDGRELGGHIYLRAVDPLGSARRKEEAVMRGRRAEKGEGAKS